MVGAFQVIATQEGGTLADTALVAITPVPAMLAPPAHSYTTSFPLTENPISESGAWINGGTVGLDWTNVSSTPGLAVGHQCCANYTDATAILTGTWAPDQQVTATVYAVNPKDACYQEVELRLRSVISARVNRGYEISFKASPTSSAYVVIVRWNGALGNYTVLTNRGGAQYGVKTGDIVSARMIGNVITVYKNGVQVAQVTDNVYTTGTPGMGFNLNNGPAGCAGTNGDYGFTNFTATDTQAALPPPTLTQVILTPATASVQTGGTQQFAVSGKLSDGSTTTPAVTYSATGGTITTGGLYTAGSSTGTFRVIAVQQGGTLADTAAVTLTPASTGHSYTTDFPLTETPVSEGGKWIGGHTTGLVWSDASTSGGKIWGRQQLDVPTRYGDATAILTGPWGADQSAEGVVAISSMPADNWGAEIELRLRSAISANVNRGYEITWKVTANPANAYLVIVRWNGALGSFDYLARLGAAGGQNGTPYAAQNGDVLKATIVGNTIHGLSEWRLAGHRGHRVHRRHRLHFRGAWRGLPVRPGQPRA